MKLYIHIIVFLFLTIQSWGQFPSPSVSTQSPNAASLGMYGEVPVSLYTGVPQIGIPLYELNEAKLSVPISLNYHASGVRPNQHPGWVGMGWNLSAGGVITRKVKDITDEYNYQDNILGFFNRSASIRLFPNNPDPNYWESNANLSYLTSGGGWISNYQDTEPDEFSFNFLGYSGSFYLDAVSGKLQVNSEHQFKVEFDANLTCPSFASEYVTNNPNEKTFDCNNKVGARNGQQPFVVRQFKLTDLNGVSYTFGSDESAIEFGLNFFQQYNTQWIANAWYLKKIETLDGRQVVFNYDAGNPADIQDNFPFLLNLNYSHYKEDLTVIGSGTLNPSCYFYNYRDSPFLISGDLIRPVYLKEIIVSSGNTANNHKIVFEKSLSNELKFPLRIFNEFKSDIDTKVGFSRPEREYFPYLTVFTEDNRDFPTYINRLKWYKLDRFKVYNQNQEIVAQYDFNYIHSPSERLFLSELTKKETGTSAGISHTFNYFDRTLLPEYFHVDDKTDHWGYLNEGTGGPVRAIAGYANEALYFNKKQPTTSETLAKAGTLSSIVYPTGGTMAFDYELNSFSKVVSAERNTFEASITPATTGGLRIKQTVACESPSSSNCITKEYFYVHGYTATTANPRSLLSSGILNGFPKYAWNYDYTVPGFNVNTKVFSINNLLPSSQNINGSPIGYSEVVEKTNGNGYTIYKFTNFGTDGGEHFDEKVPNNSRLNLSGVRTIYEPFNDKSFERGKLRQVDVFTNSGVQVSAKTITYSKINDSFIRGIKASTQLFCNTSNNIPTAIAYKIYKTQYLPTEEINTTYSTGGTNSFVAQIANYEYNTLGLEKIKKIKQSDGSELVTRKVYVGDLFVNDAQLQNNAQNYCLASPRPLEYNSCYFPCVQSGGTNCEVTCNTQCVNSYINQRVNKPNTVDLRQMLNSYVLSPVIEQQTWKLSPTPTGFDEKLLSGGINFFKKYTNGFQVKQSYSLPQLPDITDLPTPNQRYSTFPYSNIDTDYNFNFYNKYSSFAPVVKFDDVYGYDSKGNICQFNGRDGVPTTYIWGYQNMYPVATIVGATYQEVVSYLGYSPNEDANFQSKLRRVDILPLLQALRNAINTNKPIAQVTTRTYLSGVGVDSETAPSGLVVSYEYDSFNRLKTVFDNAGKVIKSYKYNYKNQQ